MFRIAIIIVTVFAVASCNSDRRSDTARPDAGEDIWQNAYPNARDECGGCSAPVGCPNPEPDPCACPCPGDFNLSNMTDVGTGDIGTGDIGTFDAEMGSADMTLEMSSDAGAPRFRGTCESSADCGGDDCITVPDDPNGYHTCRETFGEPTSCNQDGMLFPQDDCCKHEECADSAGGRCIRTPIFHCGGALPPPQNQCFYDQCSADADCIDAAQGEVATCVPEGAFGEPVARCVYGDCQLDADCDARAGGECTAFFAPCATRFRGFFCTYDDSTCRQDSDCPPPQQSLATSVCIPDDGHGETRCAEWLPPI